MKFKGLREYSVLFVIVLAGAFLRFYNLDFQSLWLDEIHTMNEADPSLSLKGVYEKVLLADPHPPLYFYLTHFVLKVFGYTSVVLRSFSALLGLGGIIAIYFLGRELINKKVGLYASALLSVNYFHVYYSQEGRMYALLFLMTTLAFYCLIRFIRQPGWRSALMYGLSAAGMLYCHFFALFTFCSQALILLIFVLYPYGVSRAKFLVLSMVAGLTAVLLFLPTYEIFQKAATRDSIWIPMPGPDVYTQTLADFFGGAEVVVLLSAVLALLALNRMLGERASVKLGMDPQKDKYVFAFVLLFSWGIITLLLPLIRTYTALPLLINRYFINLVPAVILVVSMGLYTVRMHISRMLLIGALVAFSLVDIFLVKKYYHTVGKTQFRELSNFILRHHTGSEPVVSSLGWYFPYYLQNGEKNLPLVDKSLQDYVNDLSRGKTMPPSFWYVDAHGRTYDLDYFGQRFLSYQYRLVYNLQLYNGWLHKYVRVDDGLEQTALPAQQNDSCKFNIEHFRNDSTILTVKGWAYIEGKPATHTRINAVVTNGTSSFKMRTKTDNRPDVTAYFKSSYDLSRSGFNASAYLHRLPPGTYTVGILLVNDSTGERAYIETPHTFVKL
jgi:4-amino-4-deoxy-L-arabinose transferase-like glycosyltransferase